MLDAICHLFIPILLRCSGLREELRAEAGLIDQFTCYAADTIGFIFNTHQGFFQVIDKGDLAAGHLAQLFPSIERLPSSHGHITVLAFIATHFIFTGDQSPAGSSILFWRLPVCVDQFEWASSASLYLTIGARSLVFLRIQYRFGEIGLVFTGCFS